MGGEDGRRHVAYLQQNWIPSPFLSFFPSLIFDSVARDEGINRATRWPLETWSNIIQPRFDLLHLLPFVVNTTDDRSCSIDHLSLCFVVLVFASEKKDGAHRPREGFIERPFHLRAEFRIRRENGFLRYANAHVVYREINAVDSTPVSSRDETRWKRCCALIERRPRYHVPREIIIVSCGFWWIWFVRGTRCHVKRISAKSTGNVS